MAVSNQFSATGATRLERPDRSQWRSLRLLDVYWRAANYLSVGQIYLLANPLLREPLRLDHMKRRLLGHSITVCVEDRMSVLASGDEHVVALAPEAPIGVSVRKSGRGPANSVR